MDKKEALGMFGGDVEAFEAKEIKRAEAAAAFKETQDFADSLVSVWYDKDSRFAISNTARLYNANDIQSFNIPVLEPEINCKATPGFLPKMKAKEFNKAIRSAQSDLAIPIFADENCIEDCLGFVICRGGDKFEILDSNAFGENEYSKDELFDAFKIARIKGSIINRFRKSGGQEIEINYDGNFSLESLFLDAQHYNEKQTKTLEIVLEHISVS